MPDDLRQPPDYGPDIREKRIKGQLAGWLRDAEGKLVVRNGKRQRETFVREPDVVREDRPDIGDPAQNKRTVRGARRRDGLLLMWRRKELSEAQMAAAERLRTDWAIAEGARQSMPGEVSRARGRNFEPSLAQMDAVTACRKAWAALDPRHRPVVSWVIVAGGTLGGYEVCNRMRHGRAKGMLTTALDVLADFYTAGLDRAPKVTTAPARPRLTRGR